IEHAEHSSHGQAAPGAFRQEGIDTVAAVVRHDLGQVELGVGVHVEEVSDLSAGVSVRVCPSAQRKAGAMTMDFLAKLPGVRHASRWADALVAAENDERLESVLMRAVRIREAIVERMLGREKRHDLRSRHVAAEIRDQMSQVVFLLE